MAAFISDWIRSRIDIFNQPEWTLCRKGWQRHVFTVISGAPEFLTHVFRLPNVAAISGPVM
jgi:hypothetical protein